MLRQPTRLFRRCPVIVDASGSQDHFSKHHKHDLEVFLQDVLGPKDLAFMLCFGNHLRLVTRKGMSNENSASAKSSV